MNEGDKYQDREKLVNFFKENDFIARNSYLMKRIANLCSGLFTCKTFFIIILIVIVINEFHCMSFSKNSFCG